MSTYFSVTYTELLTATPIFFWQVARLSFASSAFQPRFLAYLIFLSLTTAYYDISKPSVRYNTYF